MLIKRVRAGIESEIIKEQCLFRQGRLCMDQVFAVTQVCEKFHLPNGKEVFWALMYVFWAGIKAQVPIICAYW